MKMTSTRADLGDDEGILIRRELLCSRINRYFSPRADKISTNSPFKTNSPFFPFQYFQTK